MSCMNPEHPKEHPSAPAKCIPNFMGCEVPLGSVFCVYCSGEKTSSGGRPSTQEWREEDERNLRRLLERKV